MSQGSTILTTFGERLRVLIAARGLSRAELARRSGLSANYLYKLEHDYHPRPSGKTLEALATGLDVPTDMLLDEHAGTPEKRPITQGELTREIYDAFFSDSDLPFEDVARGVMEFLSLADRPEVFRIVVQQLHGLQREREAGRKEERLKMRRVTRQESKPSEAPEHAEANGIEGGGRLMD